MDILNGFDLAIELDRTTLLTLLQSQPLTFSLMTPFERAEHVDEIGDVHIVITALDVRLLRDPARAQLVLTIERLSLLNTTSYAAVQDRSGTINIFLGVSLVEGADRTERALALDLQHATVTVHLDPRPDDDARTSSSLSALQVGLVSALVAPLRAVMANPRLPLPIRVNPDAPPSLDPLVVSDLRLAVFDSGNQSLGLFANVSRGAATPAPARRTSAIPEGRNAVIALSPTAFRRLVFAPAVQRRFGLSSPDLLPAPLGRAPSASIAERPEVAIVRIEDTLTDGGVAVALSGRHETVGGGLGGSEFIDINGRLTFEVSPYGTGRRIVPRWRTERVSGGSEVGWGWWALSIFVSPLFYGLIGGRAAAVSSAIGAQADAFTLSTDPIPAPTTLPGVTLAAVTVEPEQFVLEATAPPSTRRAAPVGVVLEFVSEFSKSVEIAAGTYHSEGCPDGDYPWRATARVQRVSCTARPTLAARPARYMWRVSGYNAPVDAAGRGEVEILADVLIPDPAPGRREPGRTLRIPYDVSESGDRITLTIDPEMGNFRLNVGCVVIDAGGRRAASYGGLVVRPREVALENNWEQDVTDCVRRAEDEMARQGGGLAGMFAGRLPEFVLPPDASLVNTGLIGPGPASVAAFVLQATLEGEKGRTKIANAYLTYGPDLASGAAFAGSSFAGFPAALGAGGPLAAIKNPSS